MTPHAVLLRKYLIATLLGAAVASAAPRAADPAALVPENGSLAQAYKIISSKQFVDLTHSFSPATPVWAGFGHATFSAAADPKTGQPIRSGATGFVHPCIRWWVSMAHILTHRRISTPLA